MNLKLDRKAEIGTGRLVMAILIISMVFFIWLTVFNEWGSELAGAQGGEGVNISSRLNNTFINVSTKFEQLKPDIDIAYDSLLKEDTTWLQSAIILFTGAVKAVITMASSAVYFPAILIEMLEWIGVPSLVSVTIISLITLTVLVTLIKAFASGGKEV